MKLGIVSDTHGYMDERIAEHLSHCDSIWHAGDVGNVSVIEQLSAVQTTAGVYGNIDGAAIRARLPEYRFEVIEDVPLLMIHIAGPIGRYNPRVRELIEQYRPKALICGHSHILKVAYDERFKLLYVNPGAAGRHGFHKVRTLIRMDVEFGEMKNCEVVELGPRSAKAVH